MGNVRKRVKYGRYYYLKYFLVVFLPELCLFISVPYKQCHFSRIIAVIFSDIVLILGEKSRRPGFLAFWMIVYGVNITLLFLLWVAIGLVVYFMEFAKTQLPFMAIKSLSDIWNRFSSELTLLSLV